MIHSSYEVQCVHPVAATWLTTNGYSYEHEQSIPPVGTVDFLAWNHDGKYLLVECKIEVTTLDASIEQVLRYQSHCRKSAVPMLAIPGNLVTDSIRERCAQSLVQVIPLDVEHLSPLNLRVEVSLARAVRLAAVDADMSVSELVREILLGSSAVRKNIKPHNRPADAVSSTDDEPRYEPVDGA